MPAKPIALRRASTKAKREVTLAAPQLAATGFIRQAQLIPTFVPFSSATLWRLVSRKKFPQPVRLSERITAWKCEDIHAWLQAVGTQETRAARRATVTREV